MPDTLPKATVHLKSHGWRPEHAEAHPNATMWISPSGQRVSFITAVLMQPADKKAEGEK